MPRKCCVKGCKSNYDSGERCTVYSFPRDEREASIWMTALPTYSSIYGEIQCDQVDHGESECCRAEVSHADVRKFDDIHIRVDHLSSEERASIYYICGYIAHKENFPRMPEPGRDSLPEDSEFTALLSRCRLRYPPEWLVVYACFCYTYFLTSKSQCVNYIVRVFLLIFESFLDVPVGPIKLFQVSRRLSNCFFQGIRA